jgi:hypothetical protein
MIRNIVCCLLALGGLRAAVINTNDLATVAAFQAGATVVNFDSISGRTPQTITSYTTGSPVSATSFILIRQKKSWVDSGSGSLPSE